ncbi:MAG: hypothetical protein JSR86_13440, partial [Proteobacteria bacterium]|nr:hypothetical protein [Pseudomonadota bacterium]
ENPALSPAMRARRASLLQARALHRLAGGDTAGALVDLDGADAAVAGEADPFVARSLGISLALARARVLAERGDALAARELALKAWRQRPYDAKVAIVAAMVLAAAAPPGSAPSEDERALLARCAQLRPRLATPALAGLLAASPAAGAPWRPTLSLGSPALALFDDLPAPEAQAMAAPWAEARRGALTGRGSINDRNLQGFRLTEHPELGTVTAEFRARGATADLVEEGALLAAANAALAAGKPGFIVLDSGDTDLYENNSYYGVVLSTRLSNRTTVLEILPVDPKALPAAHGADGWRVLDAAAVRAALAPLFPPPAPRG